MNIGVLYRIDKVEEEHVQIVDHARNKKKKIF